MEAQHPNSVRKAREQKLRFYFTGRPCPAGHIALRYTSTMGCVQCNGHHQARFLSTEAGQASMRESQKKYYHANKEARHANVRRWRAANLERAHALYHRYAKSDIGRATRAWHAHLWEGAHPKARTVYGQEGVTEIYAEARRQGLTVDHIDPLNHELICGLHNRFNLQLLSREENGRKGSRWPSNTDN